MSKRGCLLVVLVASTQLAYLAAATRGLEPVVGADAHGEPTPVTIPTVTIPAVPPRAIPTVSMPVSSGVTIPTVVLTPPVPTPTATPPPTPTATARPKRTHRHARNRATASGGTWIVAYLTSYCPASAGWISASGLPVFYGMLANDYYPFGTRVYLPVLGITGVVEDRIGADTSWNHFDVWSPICYSTPTGYYRVEVEGP